MSMLTMAMSAQEYIAESISQCFMDDRPELYANIVIAGGTTCFPGFEQRLEEVRSRIQLSGALFWGQFLGRVLGR